MNRLILTLAVLALSMQVNDGFAGDVFDKAEGTKDCLQNNNCEGRNKWIKRMAALKKCQEEGSCTEKALEFASKNTDKVVSGANKINSVGKCLNTTDPDEQKECYEAAKAGYRDRQAKKQAKKEEAARVFYEQANKRKSIGDAVCNPGTQVFGLIKVKIKGYVEQVSGNRIQIRIADTQGQEISYQDVSLHQNTLLWDDHNKWIQCKYL